MNRDLYLGIDIGGTAMKYALTDGRGAALFEGEVPTLPADPIASLQGLRSAIAPLTDGDELPRLAAVGLACAGIVNPESGHLGRSPNLPGWENSPLGQHLRSVFGDLPCTLANDVNGALYGEFRHGAGKECESLIMLALGTGVGGGVIIENNLLLGAHCGAGEVGHMQLDAAGPSCTCGGRGCLEAYAGSVGILRDARACTGEGVAKLVAEQGAALTTADLARLAERGDEDAREIFGAVGRRLGQAIGNLVNVLDPDKVIIGGGVAKAGDLILEPCREVVPHLVLAAEAKTVPIVPAELGNLAAAMGVASLAQEKETSG